MADRKGPERERQWAAQEAEPPARDGRLWVAPTANAKTASLKSTEREPARKSFATQWQRKEAAKAGGRAARRWQTKEKRGWRQTVALDSRECGETRNPARKRVRR